MSFLPGWFPGALSRKPIVITRIGNSTSFENPGVSSHSWSGAIAAKDYPRLVIVCFTARRNGTDDTSTSFRSCSIAGVAATLLGQCELRDGLDRPRTGTCCMVSASLAANVSGNLNVSFSPDVNHVIYHALEVTGSSGSPIMTISSGRAQTQNLSQDVASGSAIIGMSSTTGPAAAPTASTWTGLPSGNEIETRFQGPVGDNLCTLSTNWDVDLPPASPNTLTVTLSVYGAAISHRALTAQFRL